MTARRPTLRARDATSTMCARVTRRTRHTRAPPPTEGERPEPWEHSTRRRSRKPTTRSHRRQVPDSEAEHLAQRAPERPERLLEERGLLESTLVLCLGEFGRTPRINPRSGRDHFPRAFSAALAGCGVRGGQVIGATTADGNEIADRPIQIPDFFRTVFTTLGVDPDHENMSSIGRPIKVVDGGEVVSELFA